MRTLTLYPTKQNLQKGVAFGLGAVGLAIYLYTLDADIEFQVFALISCVGGLWMAVKSAYHLANPKPVFDADAEGFSVKGKAKRPWSQFRGVSVYRAQSGLITVGKFVRVKVGKSMLGGNVQIGMTEMSGSAEEMVFKIGAFAEAMKSGEMALHQYQVPPVGAVVEPPKVRPQHAAAPQPEPVFAPRPLAARIQAADAGPVQSVPSMGERLFGRRKVM